MNIKPWGNQALFVLLSIVCNEEEESIKSTSAMQIDGVGCVLKTSVEKSSVLSETSVFIPDVEIVDEVDEESGRVTGRHLAAIEVEEEEEEGGEEEEEEPEIDQTLPGDLEGPEVPDQGLPATPEPK